MCHYSLVLNTTTGSHRLGFQQVVSTTYRFTLCNINTIVKKGSRGDIIGSFVCDNNKLLRLIIRTFVTKASGQIVWVFII